MPSLKPILLIEDDPDYEQFVRAVLAADEDAYEVTSAGSLRAGLASIERSMPEVILLDLTLPDSSGYETFLKVRERTAGIPIIVLTALDDDHIAIQTVEDGAQDYLVKSYTQPKHLARSLKMAVSRQSRVSIGSSAVSAGSGMVLSLIGSKGGVGTSTTAVNLGALLAHRGYETVVVELQEGRPGTLSLYFQGAPAYGLDSLFRMTADTITPASLRNCLAESPSELHLLCTNGSRSSRAALGADHVRALIAAARRVCPYTVLDLPSHIDDATTEALRLSDSVILIVDREWASLGCGVALLEQIHQATSQSSDVRLVLVDRAGLGAPTRREIEKQFKMQPLTTIPSAGAAIALSHVAHTPLVALYPDQPFSLAHVELAEGLLPYVDSERHMSHFGQRSLGNRPTPWRSIPETMYS